MARGRSGQARPSVENDEYAAFVRRILHAYSRRVGDGDVEALALMLGLAEEIDTAIAEAVKGLRACGYSWAEIGSRLGITRQAVQQRWGRHHDPRACPLRARSDSRKGPLTVTHGYRGTPLDLHRS